MSAGNHDTRITYNVFENKERINIVMKKCSNIDAQYHKQGFDFHHSEYHDFILKDNKIIRVICRSSQWYVNIMDCNNVVIWYKLEKDFNEIQNIVTNHYKDDFRQAKYKLESLAKSMEILKID